MKGKIKINEKFLQTMKLQEMYKKTENTLMIFNNFSFRQLILELKCFYLLYFCIFYYFIVAVENIFLLLLLLLHSFILFKEKKIVNEHCTEYVEQESAENRNKKVKKNRRHFQQQIKNLSHMMHACVGNCGIAEHSTYQQTSTIVSSI